MFSTSPRQYQAVFMTDLRAWKAGREGAGRDLVRSALLAQIILPSAFYWTSQALIRAFQDEDEQASWDDLMSGWFLAMALGSSAGLSLVGQSVNAMVTGYASSHPINDIFKASKFVYNTFMSEEQYTPTRYAKAIEAGAMVVSDVVGGPTLLFPIINNAVEGMGLTDSRKAKLLFSDSEVLYEKLLNARKKANSMITVKKKDDPELYYQQKAESEEYKAKRYQELIQADPEAWKRVQTKLEEQNKKL